MNDAAKIWSGQKFSDLINTFDDHCSEALMLSRMRPLTLGNVRQILELSRAAACAAQELQNIAQGNRSQTRLMNTFLFVLFVLFCALSALLVFLFLWLHAFVPSCNLRNSRMASPARGSRMNYFSLPAQPRRSPRRSQGRVECFSVKSASSVRKPAACISYPPARKCEGLTAYETSPRRAFFVATDVRRWIRGLPAVCLFLARPATVLFAYLVYFAVSLFLRLVR